MRILHRIVLASVAVLVLGSLGVAAFVSQRHQQPAPRTSTPRPTNVVTHAAPTTSEKPVTAATFRSTAVGNQPKYIKLPSIHAEGYTQAVGIDQTGAVAAPTNVNLAGWYTNSLAPGEAGLSIIDGHVDGTSAPGIFHALNKLTVGDSIEVDLANGQQKLFTVQSVEQLPAQDAATALFARNYQFSSQLNLITCGGVWSNSAHAYTDRIIVVASLK